MEFLEGETLAARLARVPLPMTLTRLDVRVSKTVTLGSLGRVELLMDVLNTFNRATEEGLAADNLYRPNFGLPTVFADPSGYMSIFRKSAK